MGWKGRVFIEAIHGTAYAGENLDCYDSFVSLLLWTKNCCFLLSPSVGAEPQPRAKRAFSGRQCGFSECEREYPLLGSGSSVLDQQNKDFILPGSRISFGNQKHP